MEDERIVPVPVSVYKAEVWRHLGFYGNVRPGTAARPQSVLPLAASHAKRICAGHGGR